MVSREESIQNMKNIYKNVLLLPVDQLFVDDNYQRKQSRTMIHKIKKTFDPALFGILKVAKRDGGKYAVVDGQHRYQAAKELGLGHIVCQVISAEESSKKEAEEFVKCNTSARGLSRLDILKSSIHAENAFSMRMNQIAEQNGFSFSNSKVDGNLKCVFSCEEIMKKGEDVFDSTLRVIKSAWGASGRSTDSRIIHGLGLFLWGAKNDEESPQVNEEMLINKMKVITPDSVLAGSGAGLCKSKFVDVAMFFQNLYNQRLKQCNRINIRKLPAR